MASSRLHQRRRMVVSTMVLLFFSICRVQAVKTRLTWVNGIGYSIKHMESEAPVISRLFGGKHVDFYHNPTSMVHDDDRAGYYRDLTQAGTQKLGRITQEVEGLVRHLRAAVQAVGSRGTVIHIAHSQGALVTFLACQRLLPKELERIQVLAFGGAAALRQTNDTPFQRCVNYYSINDPLLFVVPSAEQALRSGFVSNEEFCFLTPRVGDPIADHHLLGPTYASALAYEGLRYQRKYQSLVQRVLRSLLLVLVALIKVLIKRCATLYRTVVQALQTQRSWHTIESTIISR
mmetsp:Transcript_10727/g.19714  ORF Transcript_10727/g.19714 Transcript_10727/m.19714 type:complete len:290 (+) Transcript_10727:263-1132(+)